MTRKLDFFNPIRSVTHGFGTEHGNLAIAGWVDRAHAIPRLRYRMLDIMSQIGDSAEPGQRATYVLKKMVIYPSNISMLHNWYVL
jgi:hypothetical protein